MKRHTRAEGLIKEYFVRNENGTIASIINFMFDEPVMTSYTKASGRKRYEIPTTRQIAGLLRRLNIRIVGRIYDLKNQTYCSVYAPINPVYTPENTMLNLNVIHDVSFSNKSSKEQ